MQEIASVFALEDSFFRREFSAERFKGVLFFKPNLTDAETLRYIISSLRHTQKNRPDLEDIKQNMLLEAEAEVSGSQTKGVEAITNGDVLVFLEHDKEQFLIVNARKWPSRAVAEPPTETVMKGPREGFTEDLKTNVTLLERRLHTPSFAVEKIKVGRYTNTNVAVCYVKGIADPDVIKEVKDRLLAIDIDAIYDAQYLVPYLEPRPESMFHQVGISEKPDIITAKIMEGRVAVIVDGSPMVLTAPFILLEDLQSGTDYYERSQYTGFFRILRIFAMIAAILLPGVYVSIQVFHYNIIPLKYLVTLMNAAKGIPFPPLAEMLVSLILFEIVREASLQMPRAVGMATAIVGTLVLGETAVSAGILSSPVVMFAALSSLAVYVIPNLVGTLNILRIVLTVVGGICGLYGMCIVLLFTVHYLCQMEAYKTPYLAPFSPLVLCDLKDTIGRPAIPGFKKRPKSIPNVNKTRQA